jgi:methylated-DNA-protein-cysteine methyltransferase-like protein
MNSLQPHRKVGLRRLETSRPFVPQSKLRAASLSRSPRIYPPGVARTAQSASSSFFSCVYALVLRVPRGRVVTYGQVARARGAPRAARTVGWAMRVSPENVPWHRVVNARGEISLRPTTGYHEQRARLKAEGIRFDRAGRIDLDKYGWKHI